MIVAHPDNVTKLIGCLPTVTIGDGVPIPIDSIEIKADPNIPRTRKTGRVVWQRDPFVTYEESDRQWGLALGFCREEEEAMFLDIELIEPVLDEMYAKVRDEMERRVLEGFGVPQEILGAGSFSNYATHHPIRFIDFGGF